MKRACIVAGCLALTLVIRARADEPKQPPALSVRIVPDRAGDDGARSITLWQPSSHFNVVVTNISDKPVRLWREWCSWGYFALSFVVTDEAGKAAVVKKSPRDWDKNYPDWTELAPGDSMVFEVTFAEGTWTNSPLPAKNASLKVRMKAAFEVREDGQSKKLNVWTGKVESPELSYTIYR
jgi:hypothetical protein